MNPISTFKHFEGSRVMKRSSHDSDCKFFKTQLQEIKMKLGPSATKGDLGDQKANFRKYFHAAHAIHEEKTVVCNISLKLSAAKIHIRMQLALKANFVIKIMA